MLDLAIIETGNGGDLKLNGNDFAIQNSWGNMPYLAMFGGNPGGITSTFVNSAEQRTDWWANSLLFQSEKEAQMNSYTESELMNVSLTSAGLSKIKAAVEKDLEFMKSFSELSVSVSLVSDDNIKIDVVVITPGLNSGKINSAYVQYIFIWDSTLNVLGDFSINDFNDDFFV